MSCDELLLSTDHCRLLIQAVCKTPFACLLGLRVSDVVEQRRFSRRKKEERKGRFPEASARPFLVGYSLEVFWIRYRRRQLCLEVLLDVIVFRQARQEWLRR
jgi:hypothetical protein